MSVFPIDETHSLLTTVFGGKNSIEMLITPSARFLAICCIIACCGFACAHYLLLSMRVYSEYVRWSVQYWSVHYSIHTVQAFTLYRHPHCTGIHIAQAFTLHRHAHCTGILFSRRAVPSCTSTSSFRRWSRQLPKTWPIYLDALAVHQQLRPPDPPSSQLEASFSSYRMIRIAE